MSNTAIMLHYYYPPLIGIGSERAASFARHLPSFGWNPVVVAPRLGHYHYSHENTQPDAPVHRTRNPEISRLLRRAYQGQGSVQETVVRPIATSASGTFLRNLVRDFLYIPDAQWPWIPFAARAVRTQLRKYDGSLVFSSSVPYSSHLAAALAARLEGVPWVAEFRDPWTRYDPAFRPSWQLRLKLNRWLERQLLQRADHLVVTAKATVEAMKETWPELPEARTTIIRNGYENYHGMSPSGPKERLTLVHAGSVLKPEYVAPFVEAARALNEEEPGSIRLDVYGLPDPWKVLMREGDEEFLKLLGVVTPLEAREAMHLSTALILPVPEMRDGISGRLMEYIGARKPILATLPRKTEMNELLQHYADGRIIYPHEQHSVLRELKRLLAEHRSGDLEKSRINQQTIEPLSRISAAGQLAQVFSSCRDSS